jgi:FKBP-type peptidyl-prolyl cis-trans isomerase SlyD
MQDTIIKNSVVEIHYTLCDENKAVLDSTEGAEPLCYLHGHGQIIPGLERELAGKKVGDKLDVVVMPKDGYGDYDASQTSVVSRHQFPKDAELAVNSMFQSVDSQGHPVTFIITHIEGDSITVDANSPLAGKKLFFAVEITSIREASKEELEHGHAHGPGGHHHA